jgi:hypothetical protein
MIKLSDGKHLQLNINKKADAKHPHTYALSLRRNGEC